MTHYCGTPNMIKIKAPNIDKIPIPYSRQSKVAQFRCWKSPSAAAILQESSFGISCSFIPLHFESREQNVR